MNNCFLLQHSACFLFSFDVHHFPLSDAWNPFDTRAPQLTPIKCQLKPCPAHQVPIWSCQTAATVHRAECLKITCMNCIN